MDFPTFPPHFPNTDYLFYPSLHPSSAFSIPSPSSSFFFDDSTRELNDPATELGNLENDILTAGGAESLAASRRRLRSKIRKRTTEEADGLDIELYEYVILFSPGNPGLIGYYRPFLSKLSELLSQKKEDQVEGARERPPISVLGISHAGFSLHDKEETNYEDEDEDEDESDDAENDADEAGGKKTSLPRRKWTNWGPPPYGLQAQIGMKVELIEWIYEWYRQRREDLATIHKDGKSWKKRKLKVILMGHSVGGYILLETVRLLNLRKKERGRNGVDSNGTCNDVDVVGGILLFPTIQDIALSKKGRIFTPVVTKVPKIHLIGKIFLYMILYILPSGWLRWLVGRVTGFGRKPTPRIKKKVEIQKEAEDEEMLGVTMGFLQSRFGVEEALYMCRDEMLEIKEDKWDEEIWGVPSSAMLATSHTKGSANRQTIRQRKGIIEDDEANGTATNCSTIYTDEETSSGYVKRRRWSTGDGSSSRKIKLVMYFGKDDHWVADQTRDNLIKSRGRRFQPHNPTTFASRQRRSSSSFRRPNVLYEAPSTANELDSYIDSGYADDNDTTTTITDWGEGHDGRDDESVEDPSLAMEKYKPQMIICKEGLPHGFCIAHGEVMSSKVFGWVDEIVFGEEDENTRRDRKRARRSRSLI